VPPLTPLRLRVLHGLGAAGGRIWLDPELTLTHVDGGRNFTGRIGDWLRKRMKVGRISEEAGQVFLPSLEA